jgi:hypothetical protein
MMPTLYVSTRKGLFTITRHQRGMWSIEDAAFLGDSVSLMLPDRRDGARYVAFGLGHFGVKLRRSRDHGETWDELAAPAFPPMPEGTESKLSDGRPWPWRVDQIWSLEAGHEPNQLWCGTIGGGLFRSDDAGDSWRLVESLWNEPFRKEWFGGGADMPGIHSVCVHPTQKGSLLVGVSCGGAWRSDDAGLTWRSSAKGMYAAFMPPERKYDEFIQDPHRIVQSPSDPRRLWTQHHNAIFRSDDGGATWNDVPDVAPSVFGFAVAVHPHEPDTAWFVPMKSDETRHPVNGELVVTRTRDAGKTFTTLCTGLPQQHAYDVTYRHALDVADDGETLAFGTTTGSLYVTEDGGDTWSCIAGNLPPVYAVRFGA